MLTTETTRTRTDTSGVQRPYISTENSLDRGFGISSHNVNDDMISVYNLGKGNVRIKVFYHLKMVAERLAMNKEIQNS